MTYGQDKTYEGMNRTQNYNCCVEPWPNHWLCDRGIRVCLPRGDYNYVDNNSDKEQELEEEEEENEVEALSTKSSFVTYEKEN